MTGWRSRLDRIDGPIAGSLAESLLVDLLFLRLAHKQFHGSHRGNLVRLVQVLVRSARLIRLGRQQFPLRTALQCRVLHALRHEHLLGLKLQKRRGRARAKRGPNSCGHLSLTAEGIELVVSCKMGRPLLVAHWHVVQPHVLRAT